MIEDETNPELDSLFEDDPGSLAEIGEEDADDLNISNISTKIWLVKVPNFLAEKWKNVDQDSMNLGTVRIYNRNPEGSNSHVKLILPDNEMTSDIPKEYSIKIPAGEVENKYVFGSNEHGAATRVVGKIHHECHVSPANWAAYRDIMRKRVHEADRPTRSVQEIEQRNQPVFAPGASSGMPASDFSSFIPSKKPRIDKEKATRMPRNELMDMLFAAFERYPYWSLKGIAEHTKQPMQYLKEILSEICILNKRGPYTSTYQLKAEYKVRGNDNRPRAEGSSETGTGDALDGELSSDEDEDDMEMVQ
ncbi:transcription initiation factor IIF, beta subunit-domain-containing protein [Umbelopsis sp. PMI_123]|nr:transcription initiation factor IIF, beta subunit-domain-containing protein [Umbelopsis sp. PMI_123]